MWIYLAIILFGDVCVGTVEPLRIEGLVAAVFTPLKANGTVNYEVIPGYADFLLKTGVSWVFVTGTTGESLSLTVDERISILDAWMAQSGKGINVISHVGAESVEDARLLASHAETIGVKAVGCMPPVFFKPASVEALAETLAYIASASPSLPFYYYHIPSMTGVTFPMYALAKAAGNIPNFMGIKYTGLYQYPSFHDVAQILGYEDGKYEVLGGRDEMMIETLASGVVGFVGSQYNFAGELYNEIYRQWRSGNVDMARRLRLQAIGMLDIIASLDAGKNANKYIMEFAGIDIGPSRLPNLPITQDDATLLRSEVQKWCLNLDKIKSNIVSWCANMNKLGSR